MKLTLRDNLPFLTVTVSHKGLSVDVADVLVDTGSASTVFSADALDPLGIAPEPTDLLRGLRGIGGRELVYTRRIDRVAIGAHGVDGFAIEVAAMNYGFAINGILGMNFLRHMNAVLDLGSLEIDFHA
jgi:predicted aspartyl protease